MVLDAEGIELHITLNPQGMSELHVGGNWDEHYVKRLEYWNIIYKSWTDENGECIEIFPAGISMSTGFFPEFYYDTYNDVIEVMADGQVIYTIINGYSQLHVTDADGNETMYTREIEYVDPPLIDDPGQDEPMDEALRLGLAYEKALNDFDAAISGQSVYDEEGNEITDGPALAEYLYNQFVALGDFEDASYYLSFFKTRTEIVTTVHEYSADNVLESEYDQALPDYNVFGCLDEDPVYTGVVQNGYEHVDYIYNDNNVITKIIITQRNFYKDIIGSAVVVPDYNEFGQQIAAYVELVDLNGNEVNYTSTFEYDGQGRLVRSDIPYYVFDDEYTGKWTNLYEYDEQGRLLRSTTVSIPDDLGWFEKYVKRPFNRASNEKIYDENGLLIKAYYSYVRRDGWNFGMETYSYDENGMLIQKIRYGFVPDYDGMYNRGEYTWEEILDIADKMANDIFHLSTSYDDRMPEDWISNEHFDLSKWEWIPHTYEINSNETYTYDKTVTIMYIDLTPDD